jgi:glycosyltransferase involved in cell wall biosynthesis
MTQRQDQPDHAGPLVFITDEVPRPGAAGHLAVNHAIISFLAARGHDVVVVLARPRLLWPLHRSAPALDPRRVRVEGPGLLSGRGWVAAKPAAAARILAGRGLAMLPAGLRERLRRRARAGQYGLVDAVLGLFIEPGAAAWAADRAAGLGARAVLVDTIFRAPVLRQPRLAGIRSVLITHDVFHRRHASLASRGLRLHPSALTREDEAALLGLADVVVAIQPDEEALLRDLLPGRRVICAPMPATPRPRPAGTEREPGLLAFVGSDAAHNVDGLRWFLDAVWPGVRAALPDARLEVCGAVGRALGGPAPPGVSLRGMVPDLGAVLHRAAVAVAPIRAGSGLKVKLLDYLAHGLPVVATRAAAEGFAPGDERPVVVTDDAAAFAREAVRLASDAAGFAERERQAFEYCRHYAPDRVFAALADVVEAAGTPEVRAAAMAGGEGPAG